MGSREETTPQPRGEPAPVRDWVSPDAAAATQPAPSAGGAPAAETMTPLEHAQALGLVRSAFRQVRADGEKSDSMALFDWRHNSADALHGWSHHEYHAGAPLQLTREDYEAALEAASKPRADGHYVPHEAAKGKYFPHDPPPAELKPAEAAKAKEKA